MKSVGRWLLVVSMAWPLAARVAAQGDDSFPLTGTVVNPAGRPVAGARVECIPQGSGPTPLTFSSWNLGSRQTATTDPNGAFTFQVARARMVLVVHKEGLAPAWKVCVPAPGAAQKLTLAQPATLAGVVVDESDRPVAGAEVFVAATMGEEPLDSGGHRFHPLTGQLAREYFHTRTDGQGRFRLQNFPKTASAALTVKVAGKALRATEQAPVGSDAMPWAAGQDNIRLVVEPAGSVEGRIVPDSTAEPLAVAQLLLVPDGVGVLAGGTPEPVDSKPDGTFRIPDIAAGGYRLHATFGTNTLPDWVSEQVPLSVESGELSVVEIPATRGGVAEVILKSGAQGELLKGVNVNAYRLNHQVFTVSDPGGRASLRLVPGEYQLAVDKEGWQPENRQVTVEAGRTNRVEVKLTPLPRITGVVHGPDGQPAAGLPVLIAGDFSPRQGDLTTDAQGRFDLDWNPNRYGNSDRVFTLLIRDPERNLVTAQELEENAGPLNLQLEPGLTFTGHAVCEGKPVTNATATVIFWTGNMGMHLGGLATATDVPGAFKIPALPAGRRYAFLVSAPGYGQQMINPREFDAESSAVELGTVELKPANLKLAGQVVDADDKPVAGASVNMHGDGQPNDHTRTDPQGRFQFDAVCAGPVRLSAHGRNSLGNISAEGGDTNVVLRLGETATVYASGQSHKVTGVVKDPAGQPVAGALLKVFPSDSARGRKTDNNGAFNLTWRIESWQAEQGGGALLVVREPARNLAAVEDLTEDQETLEVQLQPGLTLAGRVEAPDGKPLAGAEVGAWLQAGRVYSQVEEKLATTDAEGRFELRALPAGQQYIVFASAKDRGRSQQRVDSDTDTRRIDLDPFVLHVADQVIAGQVLDARDKPVSGVTISMHGEGQPQGNVTTDREGRFSFKVCEGTVQIFAHSQSSYANASVEAGDTNIVLQLGESSSSARAAPSRTSLRGKPLPDLTALGLAADAVPAGQRVLLCLMDVEQRPSRRVARLLAGQHEALRQKGLTVIAVQAMMASEGAVNDWKQASPVPFPVGRVSEKSAATAWATSVEALPWLILTDAKRNVVAEGFPIEELEAQLKDSAK